MDKLFSLNPFKIILNAFQNLLGFALAEFGCKPFVGLSIVFTTVARFTGRNNIFRNVSGVEFIQLVVRRLRNEVILLHCTWIVPQSRRFSAISADTVKILKAICPFSRSKVCWQEFGASVSFLVLITPYIGIFFSVISLALKYFIAVIYYISLHAFLSFVWMRLSPSSTTYNTPGFYFFWIIFISLSVLLSQSNAIFYLIIMLIFPFSVCVVLSPIRCAFSCFARMQLSPFLTTASFALSAISAKFTGFLVKPEVASCDKQNNVALCTTLERPGIVDHLKFSPHVLAKWVVDSLARLGVRPVNYAGLVHATNYIAKEAF